MAILKRFALAAGILFGLVLSAGLLAAIGDGGNLGTTNQASADTPPSQHAITVSGDGSVLAKPDTAHVTLGVQIQNAELTTAQSQATTNMNAVLDALKNDGIKDEDIKTVNYSIYVNQDPNGSGKVTGYTIMNQVDVKISQIDQVGSIIDDAVSAGANNVGGIQFTVENVDDLIQQARQRAMDDAHKKAQQLAQLGGVTLGMPISISEGTTTPPQPYPMAARDAAGSSAVPIQTGQNEINVTVTVSYGF
jgi:uncharacterized protein YggE